MSRYIALMETGSERALLVDKLLRTVQEVDITVPALDTPRFEGLEAAVVLPQEYVEHTARFHYTDDGDDEI